MSVQELFVFWMLSEPLNWQIFKGLANQYSRVFLENFISQNFVFESIELFDDFQTKETNKLFMLQLDSSCDYKNDYASFKRTTVKTTYSKKIAKNFCSRELNTVCVSTLSRTELFANRTKSSIGPLVVWLARSLNFFCDNEPTEVRSVTPG